MHKNFTVDVRVASKSASETSSLDTASDQGIVFESNFRMTGVKFTFFLAYFSGLRFLVCHVQGEVRLWRAVCNKIFYFWNLRDFWEKLLIFGTLKCSVTIEMCHSNYCNFGRMKYVIFGKLLHFNSPQIEMCHFWEIEMCHFQEIEMCHFRKTEMYHLWEIKISRIRVIEM